MPAPHHSVFTGRMPFLPLNQQRQSTEGQPTMQQLIDISWPLGPQQQIHSSSQMMGWMDKYRQTDTVPL